MRRSISLGWRVPYWPEKLGLAAQELGLERVQVLEEHRSALGGAGTAAGQAAAKVFEAGLMCAAVRTGQDQLVVELGQLATVDADPLLAVVPGAGAEFLEPRLGAGELGAGELALLGQEAAGTAALLQLPGQLMRLIELGHHVGDMSGLGGLAGAVGHGDDVALAVTADRQSLEEAADKVAAVAGRLDGLPGAGQPVEQPLQDAAAAGELGVAVQAQALDHVAGEGTAGQDLRLAVDHAAVERRRGAVRHGPRLLRLQQKQGLGGERGRNRECRRPSGDPAQEQAGKKKPTPAVKYADQLREAQLLAATRTHGSHPIRHESSNVLL